MPSYFGLFLNSQGFIASRDCRASFKWPVSFTTVSLFKLFKLLKSCETFHELKKNFKRTGKSISILYIKNIIYIHIRYTSIYNILAKGPGVAREKKIELFLAFVIPRLPMSVQKKCRPIRSSRRLAGYRELIRMSCFII